MVKIYNGAALFEVVDEAIENIEREFLKQETAELIRSLYSPPLHEALVSLQRIRDFCNSNETVWGDSKTLIGLELKEIELIRRWNKEFKE